MQWEALKLNFRKNFLTGGGEVPSIHEREREFAVKKLRKRMYVLF